MSNHSPGSMSGQAEEPSMEDILASIRRMISEDDAPSAAVEPLAPETKPDLEATALVEPVRTEAEPAPKPIQDVAPPSKPQPLEMEQADVPEPDFSFEAFETDLDMDGDLVIPDAGEITVDTVDSDEDLIDIDQLIAEVESRVDRDVQAATQEIDPSDLAMDIEPEVTDNSDIELVKSLMADLTDDAPEDGDTDDADLSHIFSEMADIGHEDDMSVDIDLETDEGDDFNALLQIAEQAKADADAFSLGTGTAIATGGAAFRSIPDFGAHDEPTLDFEQMDLTEAASPAMEEIGSAEDMPLIQDVDIEKQETLPMTDAAEETIVGSEIEEATSSAFASLASVVERKDEVTTSGPAIGDLVKEALQPMLKEWLDKNLKGIVERSVAKEIKRIADTK